MDARDRFTVRRCAALRRSREALTSRLRLDGKERFRDRIDLRSARWHTFGHRACGPPPALDVGGGIAPTARSALRVAHRRFALSAAAASHAAIDARLELRPVDRT